MVETNAGAGVPRELPAGLTHGPSRERLAAGGLPASYAYLDLQASWHEPLLTAEAWYDDGIRLEGVEGLIVLGETRYGDCFGFSTADVLLDGATGEVYLACLDESGALLRDVLASSLDTLVALMVEVEAVTVGAAEPYEPEEGEEFEPRGPGTVAEVAGISLERMRKADPELFRRTDDRPAHWETALRVRALAWGALPGEPGGLRYALDASLVEDLAALTDGTVRRFHEEDLPAALSHAPTRQLLGSLGLPVSDRGLLGIDPVGPFLTMAETYPDSFGSENGEGENGDSEDGESEDGEGEHHRAYQGGFLAFADWLYDMPIALDGATGRLELPAWFDGAAPAAYLHQDVSALLYVVWTYERLRADRRPWEHPHTSVPWAVFHPRELLDWAAEGALRGLDPEAFASEDHFWPIRIEDGHMGSLLE
ncbi:SUKH-4 immunity protein of toxin-antitoxin system [Streptomyces sp. 1114.5]|uniref:SUKH-4 family immunity protein n=1 Tax=Streptomyces sp. 1114.5 TaxID=1938830 RepID=UPI000EAE9290|nr:SUKH-4 family immunity protein [Streptomyces sp. 1114.5]RKT19353.1 SUKH-4 immunity protein of toxin-antitoxin system [Streptomyces sp. 1114.5]